MIVINTFSSKILIKSIRKKVFPQEDMLNKILSMEDQIMLKFEGSWNVIWKVEIFKTTGNKVWDKK